MKISIVSPSLNSRRFIDEAIQSVLAQAYPDFEHIVVDGGSTDGTQEILRRYPHLRWISEPDDGQSDALNKGFAMATGEIVGWLNADETYTEGTFLKVVEEIEKKGADAVYSNCLFVNERGEAIREVSSHSPVVWLSLIQCYIPSATFFFKRAILNSGIRIDKNLHISMDKEFFAHILHSGYIVHYVNDRFATFRWHSQNKSLDSPEVRRIRYKEGLAIFNRYSSFVLPENGFFLYCYMLANKGLLAYRKYLKFRDPLG